MNFAMRTSLLPDEIAQYSAWANDAARSLHLLRAIENTLSALSAIKQTIGTIGDVMQGFAIEIPKFDRPIPEEPILATLERCQDAIEELYAKMCSKKSHAVSDFELRPSDGVTDAYDSTTSTVGRSHDIIENLRWTIMQHNADLDTSGGIRLKSTEQIKNFLQNL